LKNIFSLTTNEILSSPETWLPSRVKEETPLGELIYRYIPLEIDTLWSFRKFEAELIHKINDKKAASDVELLADLTIKLCKPYLKYEQISSNINRLINPGDFFPYELIQGFQDHFYTKSYEEELKSFMILSYSYSQSKKRNIKKNDISKLLRSSSITPRPVYDHLYKIYNNNNNFNTAFLGSFLDYYEQTIIFTSWYDGEIILGLTASAVKSRNPFIFSQTNSPTNTKSFIKAFSHLSLNKHSRKNEFQFINKTDMKAGKITENKLYIFNQFMLERIGNFNLINRLYYFQQKTPLSIDNLTSLGELVNCPLLRFRISFLDYFEAQYEKYFKYNRLQIPEWDLFLRKSILHQLTCTLPILDLVFHYLAYLATNKCSLSALFESSIDKYFDELVANESFAFFKYSDIGSCIPSPVHQFPSDMHNKNYTNLCDIVYECLLHKSFYISENENILKKLNHIYSEQQNLLRRELVPIGTNLNIERD